MSELAQLLDRLSFTELPAASGREPFGAAWLAESRRGVDLRRHGYVECEYVVRGEADRWTWDDALRPVHGSPGPFATRILVRRPADPARFSGGVQIEPLHPDHDSALTWGMIAPWILAEGQAHVGVTQEPRSLDALRGYDPDRYAGLDLGDGSRRLDVVALVAAALVEGRVPGLAPGTVSRLVLSGWSNTGTFCRTFLGEGFHRRCATSSGPALSGYVICISSGGASTPGYASPGDGRVLPPDDPRRTIGAHGVPVIELLSEGEAETHGEVLRADGDGPEDLYRLYEVAGTGHVATGRPSLLTGRAQAAAHGMPVGAREILETPTDARMDMIARATWALLNRWIVDGTPPPRAPRLTLADPGAPGPRGARPEARPLVRDADSNAVGGVRPPWIRLPRAGYLPHSTPAPGGCVPEPGAPYSDPRLLADLIAHRVPLPPDELRRRYGDAEAYLERFAAVVDEVTRAGWLREADAAELVASTRESCGDW